MNGDITEQVILDMLDSTSVSVIRKTFVEFNGQKYPVGEINRRAYVNSISGREEIQDSLEEPYLSAVMTVWGDTPIVPEPEKN